jgi:hypothetical protein
MNPEADFVSVAL